MRRLRLYLAAALVSVFAAVPLVGRALEPATGSAFAAEIARLSESEGSFDTDNLISNERAYLQVVPTLVDRHVTGGAYIGVGPDQNFSYIARIRPSVAYIIDIRRDNLLLHLLFKALFAHSDTRIEYLSHLTGRAPPADVARWKSASVADICSYVDGAKAIPSQVDALRRQLDKILLSFGVPLSPTDLATIDRFHRTFVAEGLSLQFRSFGRPPQRYYPTLRDLLLATDGDGRTWNYLAAEDDFRFLKLLEAKDAVVPVVGNVAGEHAMPAIADTIAARGYRVSAFYVSNIENYLARDGQFERFARNVERLPRNEQSVIIRSIFGGAGASTSVVAPLAISTGRVAPGLR
jgi:hypothetical protein